MKSDQQNSLIRMLALLHNINVKLILYKVHHLSILTIGSADSSIKDGVCHCPSQLPVVSGHDGYAIF